MSEGQEMFCILTGVCCLFFNLLIGMKSSTWLDEGGTSIENLDCYKCSRDMEYFKPTKCVFCSSRLGLLLVTFH